MRAEIPFLNLSAMENDKNNPTERSEEIQDIIERMPTRWAMWTALITGCLMGVVILLGFLIKYPDVVTGQVSVTAEKAPVRLVAGATGRVKLLHANGEQIDRGTVVGYIENGADYATVRQLDTLLNHPGATLPEDRPLLGELSSTYNAYVLAYRQYLRLRTSDLYTNMRTSLQRQIEADSRVDSNLELEVYIQRELASHAADRLHKDSILLQMDGISQAAYRQQHDAYLNQHGNLVSAQSSRLVKRSDISKSRLELDRLHLEESEALEQAYVEFATQRNALLSALRVWKERYLLTAPLDGRLEYLGFWRDNYYIQSGTELFTVMPAKNRWIGELLITTQGAGKVEPGQTVNVKLADFPYDEFGQLKGRVQSISYLTNKIETAAGTAEGYRVTVSFPDGIRTNFGRKLVLNFETKGSAEIITKHKRLIQRLFDNLKARGER